MISLQYETRRLFTEEYAVLDGMRLSLKTHATLAAMLRALYIFLLLKAVPEVQEGLQSERRGMFDN